jgi:tetrahydromethanopterin S-methyltransferase subunit A
MQVLREDKDVMDVMDVMDVRDVRDVREPARLTSKRDEGRLDRDPSRVAVQNHVT